MPSLSARLMISRTAATARRSGTAFGGTHRALGGGPITGQTSRFVATSVAAAQKSAWTRTQ
jgi:hypothetical protein